MAGDLSPRTNTNCKLPPKKKFLIKYLDYVQWQRKRDRLSLDSGIWHLYYKPKYSLSSFNTINYSTTFLPNVKYERKIWIINYYFYIYIYMNAKCKIWIVNYHLHWYVVSLFFLYQSPHGIIIITKSCKNYMFLDFSIFIRYKDTHHTRLPLSNDKT